MVAPIIPWVWRSIAQGQSGSAGAVAAVGVPGAGQAHHSPRRARCALYLRSGSVLAGATLWRNLAISLCAISGKSRCLLGRVLVSFDAVLAFSAEASSCAACFSSFRFFLSRWQVAHLTVLRAALPGQRSTSSWQMRQASKLWAGPVSAAASDWPNAGSSLVCHPASRPTDLNPLGHALPIRTIRARWPDGLLHC